MEVWSYVPNFDEVAAWESARRNRHILTGVSLVRCYLDTNAEPVDYPTAPRVPDWVGRSGLKTAFLVANQTEGRWDSEPVGRALADAVSRRRHVDRLLECLDASGYGGVEIDYEALPLELREPFSLLVEELARALHHRGKELAVAVHAKQSEPGESAGSQGQDWARIGAAADRVAIMAYDFDPSEPGPVSPVAWTRDALRHALDLIPATRVIQGVPLYGYLWTDGAAPDYLTYGDFQNLATSHGVSPRREATNRHMVLQYEEDGHRFEAWLPDRQTVATLASVGRELGVAGYSFWRLGGEQADALGALKGALS